MLDSEMYKSIFELSPEAIVILDTDGNIIDLNNRLYDWLGYKREDVIGKHLQSLEYLPMTSKIKAIEKFAQRMLGAEIEPYELIFLDKNKQRRTGLIYATLIKNNEGKVVGDLVMISDITKRKIAEDELKFKINELQKVNRILVNRELETIDMKKKIENLEIEIEKQK